MTKFKYAIKFFTLLLLLSSCKKETEPVTINEVPPAPKQQAEITPVKSGESTADFIIGFIAKKKQVQSKLASLSQDEANTLYEAYKKQNDSSLVTLQGYESNILENYYSYFSDERGNEINPPDSIIKKIDLLKSAGLEYWPIGEGYVEIRTLPQFYSSIFKDRVSLDYKDFIALMAKDDENLYSADAGLIIPFSDLGKRVLNWEKFISKHPYSKLTPQAIEIYRTYQVEFLLGMDNTPTIDNQNNLIYPENLSAFNTFTNSNPKSPTTALIEILLEATGTKDEISATVQREQDKFIKNLIADTTPDYC